MPTSSELKEIIWKEHLDCGQVPVGTKLPTVAELAGQYDISTPTVGKVIAMLAAEGWVTKRKGSGIYAAGQAKHAVQGTTGKRQRKIGYIAGDIRMHLAHHALQGIEYVTRKNNMVLELANTNNNIQEEKKQINEMLSRGVDGIVLYPSFERENGNEFLATEHRDYPIVVFDIYEQAMKRPHLVFDNFSAGREMTRYLFSQGHKHIVFMRFEYHPYRTVDDRVEGFRRALSDMGIPFSSNHVVEFNSSPEELGPNRYLGPVEQILAMNPRPTAIISFYDMMVPDVVLCLEHHGISVPDDITVVGFDNLIHDYRNDWPTTNPDFVRMGERATELLIECMDTNKADWINEIVIPCPLLVPNTQRIVRPVAALQSRNTSRSHAVKML